MHCVNCVYSVSMVMFYLVCYPIPPPTYTPPTPHLFQEVVLNVASCRVTLEVKVNIHVLAKPTGVIIPVGLGITKRLHDLIGPNQHVGHPARVGMVECRITQL